MNEQENTVSFFRFEDLRIYAKALDYITWLHGVIANFPDSQYVVLGEPFLKSAQAIALHIAEGSARKEQEKYTKSIKYSIDKAKASLEELANDFLSSDFLKGSIDFGEKIITFLDKIIDKIGVLPTLLTAIGAALSFKNVGIDTLVAY